MLGKKIFGFLIGFGLIASLGAAKAGMKDDDSLDISIPNIRPGFGASFTALELRPGASNLNYVIYNKELPLQSPSWNEKEIHPGYHFAFELGVRYIFPEGKDISLTWTHLNTSNSESIATPNDNFFLGPDYEIGPTGIVIRNATGSARFKYDVVNLDAGQYVDFGCHVQMRIFGGLSDAMLREKVHAGYFGNRITGEFAGPFSMQQEVKSDFNGIGPRIGLEGNYDPGFGFGFMGEIAGSLLIGKIHSKTNFIGTSVELLSRFGEVFNHQDIHDQHVLQVVPGFDAKLGVTYKHCFSQGPLLILGAGYQAAVYVNAISQYLPGTLVEGEGIETGGIFVATMNHTLSNYSVQGPFLNATLQF